MAVHDPSLTAAAIGSGGWETTADMQEQQQQHQEHQQHQEQQHHHQQQQQQQHLAAVLAFSDVSTELFQLSYADPQQHQTRIRRATQQLPCDEPEPIRPSTPRTPGTTTRVYSGPRKPSPGLAARLKALGFGASRSSRESKSPSPHESVVGRLPEEQIRKLDHDHRQASSATTATTATTAVERKSRPWKAAVVRTPSRSSLAVADTATPALPEIVTSRPLDMDTAKREDRLAHDFPSPPSPENLPPSPPPKDSPPLLPGASSPVPPSNDFSSSDYFNPLGLQRPGSVYTLSRASFADQLAQLTSIQLPDAESLSSKVSAIPTAQVATKALINAAEQIRGWICKASDVIGGLESDDDVEWAAAGGREGVDEVESAIERFGELIDVYVGAIEELQGRPDITSVLTDDLMKAVAQMEIIMHEWTSVRKTLQNVKGQVEIAMEWEELWNMVLGDIQNEMEDLGRMVFELEERRHKSVMAVASGDGVDMGDLEPIAEETPPTATRALTSIHRFSSPALPASPSSPSPTAPILSQDDSSLLALFARMQPLRASLDFLPMRLSVFEARAVRTFPTACDELEMRRGAMDAMYMKLEKDAESLRRELGEDRWVLVFRGAGRQAHKMYESVERSVTKLKEAVDACMHLTNQPAMAKKIESYEAKKTHYGPAVERVLAIIDKGVKDRLTVNGEILRLHGEMQTKWEQLKERMVEMDAVLEDLQAEKKGQQLRDSISSMLSNDRSTIASGILTPGSSPPSSVIMSSLGLNSAKAMKRRSASNESRLPQPGNRRQSSLPTPAHQIPRKPLTPRFSTLSTPSREGTVTPTSSRARPPSALSNNKPRWNGSTSASGIDTGHNFRPLSLTLSSPYAKEIKTPSTTRSVSALTPSSATKLPTHLRSPITLGRAATSSPALGETPPRVTTTSRLSFGDKNSSPGPYAQKPKAQWDSLPRPRLTTQTSMSALGNLRRPLLQAAKANDGLSNAAPRPASSMASSQSRWSSKPPSDKQPKDSRPRWKS